VLSSRPEDFGAGLVVALQQPEQLPGDDESQAPLGVAAALASRPRRVTARHNCDGSVTILAGLDRLLIRPAWWASRRRHHGRQLTAEGNNPVPVAQRVIPTVPAPEPDSDPPPPPPAHPQLQQRLAAAHRAADGFQQFRPGPCPSRGRLTRRPGDHRPAIRTGGQRRIPVRAVVVPPCEGCSPPGKGIAAGSVRSVVGDLGVATDDVIGRPGRANRRACAVVDRTMHWPTAPSVGPPHFQGTWAARRRFSDGPDTRGLGIP